MAGEQMAEDTVSTTSFLVRHRTTVLSTVYLLLLSVVYVPYAVHGGFGVGDDLALVETTRHSSNLVPFWKSFLISPGCVARPIYASLIVAELYLYKDVPAYYIITQLLIWMFGIYLLFTLIKRVLDENTAWLFAILSSFPFFSSSVVFSVFLSIGYNLSITFWALSLVFLYKHVSVGRIHNYLLSYISLMCGLLTMELILPLLLISAMFPLLCEFRLRDKPHILFKAAVRYVTPVVVVAFIFFIFKMYITKLYVSDTSLTYGLAPITLKSFLQACYYFFALFVEVPMLLIEVWPIIIRRQIILISLFIICFLIILKWPTGDSKRAKPSMERPFIILVFVAFLACSVINFLSNYPSVTFGYYNKMMHPAFLLSSILLAWALRKTIDSWKIALTAVVTVLWISSLVIQLDNFSRSWEIRTYVLTDIAEKLNSAELGETPFVIANVPFFTLNNYNNEEVFFTAWDFSAGLRMFGLKKTVNAFPFCWRIVTDSTYNPGHNMKNSATEFENENLWYYEYREESGKRKFEKIRGKSGFYEILKYTVDSNINNHPVILRERIRNALRDRVNDLRGDH